MGDMIVGMGVDIAEVSRLQEAVERHGERFLQRVFTPAEVAYCRSHKNCYERLAVRFAAKEAFMKALGTGWRRGVRWRDIEVSNRPSGQPGLKLSGRAEELFRERGGAHLWLSLTHTPQYALAEVILEGEHRAGL